MYYYFSTDFPTIIKINGQYKGKTDDLLAYHALPDEQIFVEIYPLSCDCTPFCFLVDEKFFISPPPNLILTDLKGGYLIKLVMPPLSTPFKIVAQEKFPFAVATVFEDNGLKLSIETPTDMYAENFNFVCNSVSITPFSFWGEQLLCVKFEARKCLLNCYLLGKQITPVFSKKVDSFSIENGFFTTESFLDIAKHVLTCEWELLNGRLIKKNVRIEKSPAFNARQIPPHALPYAFLEEFLLTDQVQEFAQPNLCDNVTHLRAYLGNYIGVMPPPEFRSIDEVGLIYSQSANKYSVNYFTFTAQDGKICNIKRLSD